MKKEIFLMKDVMLPLIHGCATYLPWAEKRITQVLKTAEEEINKMFFEDLFFHSLREAVKKLEFDRF